MDIIDIIDDIDFNYGYLTILGCFNHDVERIKVTIEKGLNNVVYVNEAIDSNNNGIGYKETFRLYDPSDIQCIEALDMIILDSEFNTNILTCDYIGNKDNINHLLNDDYILRYFCTDYELYDENEKLIE